MIPAGFVAEETRPRVKLYGERNTGTHYLARLVRVNLEACPLESIEPRVVRQAARRLRAAEMIRDVYYSLTFRRNLGWKHMNPRTLEQLRQLQIDVSGLRFVLLTKNPYSWSVSMLRNPYHLGVERPITIDELVQRRWRCSRRENMGKASASLIDIWCTKARSYLNLLDEARACLVRYEDLLVDPSASIASVAAQLGLQRRSETFVNVDASAKQEGRAKGRTFDSYRQYYVNEEWRKSLTPTAINAINSQLDPEVMQRIGYAIIRSA
jgi:hypothetical protein